MVEYGGVEIPADLQVVGWAHTRCRREWIDLYYPAGQAPDARAMYQDAKIVASQAEGEGLSKETRVAAYLFVITFENLWEGLYERLRGRADQDR